MARVDHDALLAAASEALGGTVDSAGVADLVFDKGSAVIAASANDLKDAFKRMKKVEGYGWVVINREDLFAANPLSIGSKVGILDARGKVLKNADVSRKKV